MHAATGDSTYTSTYPTGHTQPHTLTSVTATGASTGTSTYTYDPAGNTTARSVLAQPGQTMTWDAEGHLATLTASGTTTSYIYDANGNRIIAKDATSETVYLGSTEIHRDATNTANCTRYYTFNGTQIATRKNPGTLTWQSVDNHGTAEATIDATNHTITRLRTDPFGNPRNNNPWPSSRGFIGGTTDPTGLTHLGAREYDPTTGRFISADPVLKTEEPQQINGYSYANNTPTNASDPAGTCTHCGGEAPREGPAEPPAPTDPITQGKEGPRLGRRCQADRKQNFPRGLV